MAATSHRLPTYKTVTCKRCNGNGEYRCYGMCYGCGGRGVVQVEDGGTRPETIDERDARESYEAGLACRAARKAARDARIAARKEIRR